MKQLLFLLLFPCLALAQYQGNANQKITLGEQTTADGLVWRGLRADTASKIVPFSDTSAYIILDTVEKTLWLYKAGQVPKWQQVGGSGGGSTLDTATMLLPYYRAGRNSIIQAADVPTLNQNTTGSAATLTLGRTIQTNLASTSAATFNGSANITPGVTGVLPVANGGTGASTLAAANIITGSGTITYIPKFSATNALTNSAIYEGTGFIQSTKRLELENTAYAIVAYSTPGNRQVSLGVYLGEPAIQAHLLGGTNPRQLQINPEGGAVGIGLNSPTAALHIKAGTATASTAPLKFTSGTNLTTAEAGAMEFNGTNLFFSPSTTRHTVNHGLTGLATLDFPSTTTLLSADLTISVTGAADGDVVSIGVPNASVNANTCYTAWVSAANTVTVRFNNYSSGTVNPASGTFKVFVTK